MKKLLLTTIVASTLTACGHGGNIGVDAEKSASETSKSDSNLSKEKSMSASNSNAKKETMSALMLLGGGATDYVSPAFPNGASILIKSLANYLSDVDKHKQTPSLSDWKGAGLKPNNLSIGMMAASVSSQTGWPRGYNPDASAGNYYILAADTIAIFSNNLYSKSATQLGQLSLKNQGEAKDHEIDFILQMNESDLEKIFEESLAQSRQIQKSVRIDGAKKFGNIGWIGNGATIYADQAGWHIQKSGNAFFGGEYINGLAITLSVDNTLDNVMARKKVNTESTETANAAITKASAGLK